MYRKGWALIIISLGANLPGPHGSPEETVAAAIKALLQHLRVIRVSRLWRTAPVPVSGDPWFVNGAVAVETGMGPEALLDFLKNMERDFGRTAPVQDAPRTLDLDLIAYGDVVIAEGRLQVPHPRMAGRAFVLLPMAEVAPGWRHPVSGLSIEEMIAAMPAGQAVEAIGSLVHGTAA